MSGSFKRGISKILAIAQESQFGVLAAGPGRVLRRVNAALNLIKDGYQSNEILASQQLRDARHGVRRCTFSLTGQLSPGAYTEFWENILRRNFSLGATATGLTITAVAGPPGTFTRSAGSWISDGFKVGDVVRFTGFTAGAAANNARNYRVSDLTPTIMTVTGVAPEAVVAAASAPTIGCSVVGRKNFIPVTGHTFLSHSIEEWQPDGASPTSNRGLGMTMQSARISLPATGFCTVDFQMIGQNFVPLGVQAFPTATAASALNSLAAVNGRVRFNGVDVAVITGGQITIGAPVDSNPVVGSNIVPALFAGVISINGSATIMLRDNVELNIFENETEVDLHWYLTTDGTANTDFVTFVMNRIKVMSNQRNDGDRGLLQQITFTGLEHVVGAGAGTKFDGTTIIIQDSAA